MDNKNELSEKWIKASILGTIWAASEIVLGSFMHNLQIPFSGNILTGIAIVILISVSYVWTEKGLFWRAGLICALMKTMSPSAVIFGPMIAIISEALLLEISVRLVGLNMAGYLIGGILAMSWNLFQKIVNFIIYYGYNIVGLYRNLIDLLQKQISVKFDMVWLPILILLMLQVIFGFLFSVIGIKIGKKMLRNPSSEKLEGVTNHYLNNRNETKSIFNYSLSWLFVDIILVIFSLLVINFTKWFVWSGTIIGIIIIWSIRYKKALHPLLEPKFWIYFIVITMITALVFAKMQTHSSGWGYGLLIGLQMNFRAAIIIVGFSVLGTELYNPKVRVFFMKSSFKQLPMALELSFESLPSMVSTIPDFKTVIKNPVKVFYQIVSQADRRLMEFKNKINSNRKIFILTGSVGQGKTNQLQKILEILKKEKVAVGGIYSPRIMKKNTTIGYDIVNVLNGEREPFLRQNGNKDLAKIGRYHIFPIGLQAGTEALRQASHNGVNLVVIDEVGRLELNNGGWAMLLQELLEDQNKHILMVVRDSFVDKVSQKWNLDEKYVYDVSRSDYQTISQSILSQICSYQ